MRQQSLPRPAVPAALPDLAVATPAERLLMLDVGSGGLSEEAGSRLRMYGPNEPVQQQRTRQIAVFAGNFTHTLALLLWFASGLAFAAGLPQLHNETDL
jgi:hypothetical protein